MKIHEEWYKDGLSFSCERCGNCCSGQPGYVWASMEELEKINNYLPSQTTPYIRRVNNRFSLIEKPNGDCIFLERNEKGLALCKIHPVKPKQCKTWPFWSEILKSKAAWDEEARECPGMNKGRKYSFEEIKKNQD